jgi:hypothetical protein
MTKNAKSCFDSGKDGALYRGCIMKAFRRRFHFLLRWLSLVWFCHRFGIVIAMATGIWGAASFSRLQAQDFKPFDQFLNISTRVLVGAGDNVAVAGFIVTGGEAKRVIIRAIGPSLRGAGISNALQDPTLELHGSSGSLIAGNDNWKDTQQAEIQASGLAPADDRESAIVRTLSPGAYTAIVRGKNGTGGIALIEGYDLDSSAGSIFANISTRGFVGTGDNAMIGGLIVGGNGGGVNVVIARALGPSLSNIGVQQALQDPTLELRDQNGVLIDSNDNWKDRQQAVIERQNLAPADDRESALLDILPAGAYTAIVRGKNGATGVALVEFYNIR